MNAVNNIKKNVNIINLTRNKATQHNTICVNINLRTVTYTWGGVKAISMISQQLSLDNIFVAAKDIKQYRSEQSLFNSKGLYIITKITYF